MTKPTEKMNAREFVWVHRIRQRIAFEQIVLTVGNPAEKLRAKQFLEAMEQANPHLFEDLDQYTSELVDDHDPYTPELFDDSEYCKAKGRKTALKLPKDVAWEERVIRRAVREYRELFHPCEELFDNALKGLQYLFNLHPDLFSRVRAQAVEERDQILSFEIYCKCDCTPKENRYPAVVFKLSNQGRFEAVSKRIVSARQALNAAGDNGQDQWHFFLDRIRDIAPEMLES